MATMENTALAAYPTDPHERIYGNISFGACAIATAETSDHVGIMANVAKRRRAASAYRFCVKKAPVSAAAAATLQRKSIPTMPSAVLLQRRSVSVR